MSADNGYLLRRNQDGKYCLQMFFASADEYPNIANTKPELQFISLQGAIVHHELYCESEYGLTTQVRLITYDHMHKMEPWGENKRCSITNCTYRERWNGETFHE